MLKRIQKFIALSFSDKLLFIQAWFLLGYMRAAILTISFKKLAAPLEHHREHPGSTQLSQEQIQQAVRIGKLVASASNYTPWQSLCLAQVLVTQRLLARRNISGQFYLGVRRGCERTADPTGLSAHAWLQCDQYIVNGAAGHEQFTVVSTFSWGNAPDANLASTTCAHD